MTMRNPHAALLLCAAALTALHAGAQAQTPVPPPAAAAPAVAVAPEYRLGSGDVIRISVFQNPDLSVDTRVTEAGVVSYPLLGSVRVGGLSVTAAEKLVADGLRNGNFVKQPQVTILVMQVRGNQASVLGQLNRPGRYPIEVADMRLTDLLAAAGGVAPGGSETIVLIGTRQSRPFRMEVELPVLFSPDGRDKDVLIQNGDTVWVDRQALVYVYGEVQRPGPARIERGMTLLQTLATSGGLTLRGTDKGIRVHRKGADGTIQVLTPAMDEKVQNGDVVFVRESLF